MKNLFFFVIVIVLAFGSTSCKKSRLLNNLEGTWQVESYTSDGEEYVGSNSIIKKFEMEYKDYQKTEGNFEWIIFYNDGTSSIFEGEYVCNADGSEIELNFDSDNSSYEFDVEIQGDNLIMDGNVNGDKVIVEAERD